ncbi:transporter substrate-binding domain-containing protein [Paratractidigestivibacter faecalis]|uniref:transporter substrate-binding domain-containing protein n=1 Tax=Paratractidigestivibacter faecalis TaxID=2292441 RepID=UPI000E3B5ADF|nr:transporter substrate-binding domain-containing protein [Paratractidigestivibacter faecalis]
MKLNMNRREFLAAFGTIAASAVLAGCGGTKTATTAGAPSDAASTSAPSGDDKSAASTMKLIVGFDAAYPPYGYVGDDGSYTGFDLELAQEVGRRVGWEVQLEPIDWDAKDTLMNSGAINCIWNGFTIEGRENDYTFSEPYMLNAQVVVVKKGSGISDLAGLAGKAVITQTDSAAYDVLAGEDAAQADVAATFASLETIGDYNTAFMQLETGAVDAVACDLSIAAYQLAAKPDAYEQLSEQLSSEHYAVGFKKGDEASATQVSDTLKAMDKDGFVKDLCDKYADQGMDYANWCLA